MNVLSICFHLTGITSSSGLAATATVVHLLQAGDHLLCMNDVYGGESTS